MKSFSFLPLDLDAGLSLGDAVLAFGDLPDPEGHRRNRAVLALCEISGRELVLDALAAEQGWVNYSIDESAARVQTLKKLISGELRATGLVCGVPPDRGAVEIHRDRWRVLTPDWTASSAAASTATLIEGILVYRGWSPAILVESEPPRYGMKTARAKAWIGENRAKLAGLSRRKQAALLSSETGCSTTLAKSRPKRRVRLNSLRGRWAGVGHVHGHMWAYCTGDGGANRCD